MSNYYTGSVVSFQELLTAMVNGCTQHGWAWDGTILSKAGAFMRPYVSTTGTTTEGEGLLAELGTGRSGNAITGASGCIPRLGRPSSQLPAVTWPAMYHLFVFDNPDEVFLVLQFNVNLHYFLAFGASGINDGIWISATSPVRFSSSGAFWISSTGGGASGTSMPSGLPFWKTTHGSSTPANHAETIRSQMDVEWGGFSGGNDRFLNGAVAANPMMDRLPSGWNQAAVLLPINVYQRRPASFWSLALSIRNARYLRIDYHEPGEIITLGHEQWMVFPGHLKDLGVRNGGNGISHTGTMGWAIRYQPEG